MEDGSRVPRPPPKIWRHISVAGGYGSHESDSRISAAACSMANPVALPSCRQPMPRSLTEAPTRLMNKTIEHKASPWVAWQVGSVAAVATMAMGAGLGLSWSASASSPASAADRPATQIRSDLAPNSIRAQQGLLLDASTVGLGCVPCFKSDPPISIVCVSFRRSQCL